MKKRPLILQALLGIQMGIILSSYSSTPTPISPEMRTFYQQLDPEAQQKFQQLDPEHRRKAMSIVDQYCKAYNECKGGREESVDDQYTQQMNGNHF